MKRISVGDPILFQTNTGQTARGTVVELITERRQPTLVLIERHDGGRAIRLEAEVQPYETPARLAG
jgi:hypothetical protein